MIVFADISNGQNRLFEVLHNDTTIAYCCAENDEATLWGVCESGFDPEYSTHYFATLSEAQEFCYRIALRRIAAINNPQRAKTPTPRAVNEVPA